MCSICVCNDSPARCFFLQMENQSSNDQTGKRGIFVWREKHEMFLLREVIIHEPYKFKVGSKERGAAWTAIASELEGGFDMKVNQRSVREKFNRMIEGFKKQRASGVDVEYNEKDQALLDILERMVECDEVNEQERQRQNQRQNQEVETAEEMRKRAVERLGETRKRVIDINDEDGVGGRTPEGKRKKSGELVEILKESVKVTKNREDADREFKEREIRLREQQLNMQQQFQMSLLEQQQQFQVQQQAVTMAIVNALSELASNIKK